MITNFEGTPCPQEEEGIEKKVAWLHPDAIPKTLENSYENIKLLFEV